MECLNKQIILGRLGRDPEIKTDNNPRCMFSLATDRRYRDAQQQVQKKTQWHRVVAFGKTAETIAKYCKKGDWVYVEGRLESRDYQKQDGTKGTVYETVCEQFKFMNQKSAEGDQSASQAPQQTQQSYAHPQQRQPQQQTYDDSDVPF